MHRVWFKSLTACLVLALATGCLGIALADQGACPNGGCDSLTYAGMEIKAPTEYPGYREPSPDVLLDIDLPVTMYSQCDSAWGSDLMYGTCTCSPKTICNCGCLLTSTAMVFRSYGANTDPGVLNTCMKNKGYYTCPFWNDYAQYCSDGKAVWGGGFYTYSVSLLVSGLFDGKPPIVQWKKGTKTHWVVVRRVWGDGLQESDYWCNDPNGGVYRRLDYFPNNGWSPGVVAFQVKK